MFDKPAGHLRAECQELGVVAGVVACAHAASSPKTLEQFERETTAQFARGQWPKLYATIHPAQQKLISRADFSRCMDKWVEFGTFWGVDFSSQRFVRMKVAPQKKSLTIPGTTMRVQATVVRTWAAPWVDPLGVESWKRASAGPRTSTNGRPMTVLGVP